MIEEMDAGIKTGIKFNITSYTFSPIKLPEK